MKKISNLAGIVAAAALLCGISACDNSETITMTSAKIEMVGDPIVTDKAAIFQWKDSVANGAIVITRQAPSEEEITLYKDGWILNGFVDRVSYDNLLKAGVEYTYRFYNKSDVSAARTTEYTLEKKYSCVERKVTFPSIAPAGTKLAPITKEQVTISKSEVNGHNYVSIYVDEKEAHPYIDMLDKTTGEKKTISKNGWETTDLYKDEIGGIEPFEYNPSHDYEITVGKWWREDSQNSGSGHDSERYYDNADTAISFDLPATVAEENDVRFNINSWDGTFKVYWNGKKDSKYEISFEAFDNKDEPVTLKSFTIVDDKITRDNFFNCLATGKLSDLIDTTKLDTVKTAKATVKEMVTGKTASESVAEYEIHASYTTYTQLNGYYEYKDNNRIRHIDDLNVNRDSEQNEDGYYNYYAVVTLEGYNLPATAKLYYRKTWDTNLYSEVTGGLKKDAEGRLTAKVPVDYYSNYDFKAVVTMDNAKWYDWEEGKTEEVAEKKSWNYNYND